MEHTKQNIKRLQWETDPLYRLIRTIKNVMDRYFWTLSSACFSRRQATSSRLS